MKIILDKRKFTPIRQWEVAFHRVKTEQGDAHPWVWLIRLMLPIGGFTTIYTSHDAAEAERAFELAAVQAFSKKVLNLDTEPWRIDPMDRTILRTILSRLEVRRGA